MNRNLSLNLLKTIIPLAVLLVMISGCKRSSAKELDRFEKEAILRLFLKGEKGIGNSAVHCEVDSLIYSEFVIQKEGIHYVYVLDGSCSSCISSAIDFISCLMDTGLLSVDDVAFLSKSEENDLYRYYFQKHFESEGIDIMVPHCFTIEDRGNIGNGLYRIVDGFVTGYIPWNY